MFYDVTEVQYRGGHRVFLRFDDGEAGEIDLASLLKFEGVFAPLSNPKECAKVRLHPEWRTIHWPNGADIAPETLHEAVQQAKQRIAAS